MLTTKEVADDLRLNVRTVTRWIRCGKLRACRVGQDYRVRPEDVEKLKEPVEAADGK